MIKTEYYMTRKDGAVLNKTFSDKGMMIENEQGVQYSAVIDLAESGHKYIETDIPIPDYEIPDKEFLRMIKGVM